MTVNPSIDPARLLEEQLAQASPDLLRELLQTFVNTLLSAEADAVCGAAYGASSPERVNQRNGYRHRDFDTRAGTLDVAIPKLRQGSYFPEWLLERRTRAEKALTSVVATCYLLGVSTRRMNKLVQSLGITGLSKSQVSTMSAELDAHVEDFRTRSLAEAGPFTFVAADALVLKVREGGRVVPVHALVATGINADGHREILGIQVTTSEDGAGWLAFWRDLSARDSTGVQLVTSDAHAGLVAAIARDPARCGLAALSHPLRRQPDGRDPKSSWGWVRPCCTAFDQPTRTRSTPSSTGSSTPWTASSRGRRAPRERPDILAFTDPTGLASDLVNNPNERLNRGSVDAPTSSDLPRPDQHHPARRRGPGRATRRMGRRSRLQDHHRRPVNRDPVA